MKRALKWLSITLVFFLVSMWMLLFLTPLPPLFDDLSFSRAVYDEQQQLLRLTLSDDAKYRLYTPLSKISPELVQATLLQEDRYFYWHPGVNPISLFKALWQSYVIKSRRMGASTITMQLARIRYGIHSKTELGKLTQIFRALQLEVHYSKKTLLTAYLNLAPYGNNIEGVGAASLIYFGKSARDLNLPELLTLVVIPQNPTKRIPDGDQLQNVRNKLYIRWVATHPHDKNKLALMNLPLQMRRVHKTPFLAPHFVNMILEDKNNHANEIVTTLNLRLQKIVERVTKNYLQHQMQLGVNNAAIMLVDTRDMSTKALVGSADFFNTAIGGQINGTLTERSPGSTLKPFIYALAIDQGLIHPNTMLKDVPHSFGSYNPENFDNDFVGPIKAKDALVLSRNIPAIYLSQQLKNPSLYEFLSAANIHDLKAESYYGLALALGGAELSMQELVALYATLQNDGLYKAIRYDSKTTLEKGKPILSKEASYLVLEMLKETSFAGNNRLQAAWKTGTSSGFRDAWTIGVVGPYVLAVWIGNFNNQSNQAFIGKEIAAPLFFDIANAINTQVAPLTPLAKNTQRMHLSLVPVCKASGMLPNRYCDDVEKVWFIPGKSPIKVDTIHREIAIDEQTGLRACQFKKNIHFAVYEFWSSDLLKIFKRAGIERRSPPPYNANCGQQFSTIGFAPQIVSPKSEVNYILRLESMQQTTIPLTAVVDADVKTLYWFMNGSYLGETPRDQPLLWHAMSGKYVIRVVDDKGRADARDVVVKLSV